MNHLSFFACILLLRQIPPSAEAFSLSKHFEPPSKTSCQRSLSSSLSSSGQLSRTKLGASSIRVLSTELRQSRNNDESRLQETDKAFWLQQKQLIQDLSDVSNKGIRARQKEQFSKRRIALVGDTAYLSFFLFCGLWSVFDNPFIALSYLLGATLGLAYSYGLGKYVENIGGSVYDAEAGKGAGVGEARFAFLILLFVLVGKFQSAGLMPVPTIAGFFTYQISSLSQGLRQDLDDEE